ncbi:hypothetical protein SAMN05421823_1234 [Catalinimonas alkaloidigena]|uniref:Uncharacterized protein n=1 Tax=Catalinimonas alkaloidigena TaxID=1075417 RepID=A0A1G9VQT5_9BACT|nr:DUF6090 family protein [Catalinimonas alkaloidigena]SDM74467.1 hypothetical protein SAMN05421823_1234 [Catalinimonas alkaloidigena]
MLKKINWRYALGEILIVLVGITLAFWLNNWKDHRQEAHARAQYLTQLKRDLERDSLQLHDNIAQCARRMRSIEQLLPHLGHTLPGRDTAYRLVFELPLSIEFRPKTITYQTLINSGDYSLIDQFSLRAAIEEHYLLYDHIRKEYERQEIITSKYIGDFYVRELNYPQLQRGNYDFLDNPLLYNIAVSVRGALRLKMLASEEGVASCRELMAQLDQSLDE